MRHMNIIIFFQYLLLSVKQRRTLSYHKSSVSSSPSGNPQKKSDFPKFRNIWSQCFRWMFLISWRNSQAYSGDFPNNISTMELLINNLNTLPSHWGITDDTRDCWHWTAFRTGESTGPEWWRQQPLSRSHNGGGFSSCDDSLQQFLPDWELSGLPQVGRLCRDNTSLQRRYHFQTEWGLLRNEDEIVGPVWNVLKH